MKTAADLIKDAHQRIEKLCTDTTVSAKHRRSMMATLKPLEKALAKLQSGGNHKPTRGGGLFGSDLAPGQIDVTGIIANPNATNVDNHPLSARIIDSLAIGKGGATPFSIHDDPNMSVSTRTLSQDIKSQITPPIEGTGFVGGAKGKGSKKPKGKRA